MPKYRITTPDGKTLEVNAPEGATKEQALAYVQQNYQQSAAPQRPQVDPRQQKYERIKAELERRNGPAYTDPTEDMSGMERFWAGAGKSVHDTGRGLQQLYAGVADKVAPRERSMSDLVTGRDPSRSSEIARKVAEDREADAPLMATGAGTVGYIGGTVAQVVTPGGVLKMGATVPRAAAIAPALNMASRAFLPTTLRGAAAQGVALGALQPVAEGESRTDNMLLGGGAGALGVAIPRGVGAVYRTARNSIMAPTTSGAQREAVRTIRSLADDSAALMTPKPSAIPGARRTLFEETLVPGIARLETRSRGNANGWKEFDAANDAARQNALRGFAKDEGALDAAITARSKATAPLYAAANKTDGVDTSRLLSQIKRLEKAQEGRPAVQRGLSDVRSLLTREVTEAERKRTALAALDAFATSGRKSAADYDAARAAMTMIRRGEVPKGQFGAQAGRDALKAAQKAMKTEAAPQDKMRVIANARLTINDMLSGKYGGESGQAMAGSKALMAVKNQLDRVAAKGSPEFAQATQTFRTMSGDINRMQAGQKLIETATSKNLDPTSQLYPLISGQYGGKVKALDRLVQDATGFRKARADTVFKPEDMRTISAVQDDLSRAAARLPYGNGGGSHTASQVELGIRMVAKKALARVIPFAGQAAEFLDQAARDRMESVMTEMLRNPAEFRRVAAALPANERKLVEEAFVRIGGTSGALSPALLQPSN